MVDGTWIDGIGAAAAAVLVSNAYSSYPNVNFTSSSAFAGFVGTWNVAVAGSSTVETGIGAVEGFQIRRRRYRIRLLLPVIRPEKSFLLSFRGSLLLLRSEITSLLLS